VTSKGDSAMLKKAIGSFEWKNGKWLQGYVMSIEEQEGDDYFLRYVTSNIIGIMEPLIKYNRKTKRVYFLTERSVNGSINFPEYETKGYPAKMSFKGLEQY
jgi:hypothetical protein